MILITSIICGLAVGFGVYGFLLPYCEKEPVLVNLSRRKLNKPGE